jgi:hypothetical protein
LICIHCTIVYLSGILRVCPEWIVVDERLFSDMISVYLEPEPRNFTAIFQRVSPDFTVYVVVDDVAVVPYISDLDSPQWE